LSFQTGVAAAANQSGGHAFLIVPGEHGLQLSISDFRSWFRRLSIRTHGYSDEI
jgi:hypothetical protein